MHSGPLLHANAAFLQHRHYAVLGAGLSGRAAARLLLSLGKNAVLFDDRAPDAADLAPLLDGGAVFLQGREQGLPVQTEAVVVSPGYPEDHPQMSEARRRGLPMRGELELGFLCAENGGKRARFAAVTGTNGKTTVTSMIAQLLADAGVASAAVGNIGYPLCDAVLDHAENLGGMTFVAEVSSFQLETIEHFRPDVAVLLNITPDHYDRHGSFEAYARAKARITENQGPADAFIVNQDDAQCLAIGAASFAASKARAMRFALARRVDDGVWLDAELMTIAKPGVKPAKLMALEDLQVLGLHNAANAMAAACAGIALGLPRKGIAASLAAFQAAHHRMEPAGELDGVRYINDSKATNIDALAKAVECFPSGVHLIAGGRDKNSPFAQLAGALGGRVARAYLIGEAAATIGAAWEKHLEIEQCGTMQRALESARARAAAGEVILLAPGCASFDQFKDYKDRGEQFCAWVAARMTEETQTQTETARLLSGGSNAK